MKKIAKKITAVGLALVLSITPSFDVGVFGTKEAKAEQLGTLADEVTGTWSYWDGNKDVVQTNAMLLDKLPTIANKGITRWTTDNYDNSTGAFDIGEWGTSLMWNYSAEDQWGNSTYAIPMSYKATPQGFYVTKPSTIKIETSYMMFQPQDGSLTDFVVGPSFTAASKKVDKVTDWTYDVVFEDVADPSTYVKATIVQGSPFSYYQATGTQKMKIMRLRSLPSSVSYYNGTSITNSTMLVFEVFDNTDDEFSDFSNYDYYAVYVPEGTTWTKSAGTGYADDGVGTLTANFPSEDKAYMSFAWLCESKGKDAATAKSIAETYEDYAYNFITDTKASYEYDYATSTVTTKYEYTLDNKAESKKAGTIMGILPHQYKNMEGYTYLQNTARTIRGTMKYIAGNSYETKLTYTGILPSMMSIYEADYPTLQGYVSDFMDEYGPTDTAVTKESYSVNTYDSGKKLNRAVQVMAAAEACGDTENAEALLNGIKAELVDWFTYTGEDDGKYFYYDEGVGSLFGFPQAYYTVDGMTDHHFHYGYFINAAAQVALKDSTFAAQYGHIVDELIGDIATAEENTPNSKYPQFRYFSQYEGHSWASGHANFSDGNNQESSSEALNAWAGLILYGQATGNKELTERGIYLYTTEVSSVNNYWFDIDGDILNPSFTQSSGSSLPKHSQASMVWGGKYDYATWWTAEPLQIQGINILPMTAASFYASRDKEYILKNYQTAQINEDAYEGEDKDPNRWNEIWSVYLAMADPQMAMEHFDPYCAPEAGDSKAHAYHMIMAFDKYGTPDLSITSDNPLSAGFVNADGEKTYVAYNASGEDKTVTFSDGTIVEAKAGEMVTESEATAQNKAPYKVEHYIQTADGTYMLNLEEYKTGKIGYEITAVAKNYTGYTLDETVEGTQNTGIVTEDGTLVLKLYYKIAEIEEMPLGADPSLYTKLGTVNGADLSYYLIQDDFGVAVKLLDNNATFYMEYNGGMFTDKNTQGYMNNVETPGNVYRGVYKFNTGTLVKDKYTTLKLKSDNKLVTMIIKYGNPVGAPIIEDEEIVVPSKNPNEPTDVTSLALGSMVDNTVMVTFGETEEQNTKGQSYNVYVNDEVALSGVDVGTYQINEVSAGTCTVKVTAVLAGNESKGVTATIKVSGEKYEEPTTPEQPTTPEITTPEQPTTPEPTKPEWDLGYLQLTQGTAHSRWIDFGGYGYLAQAGKEVYLGLDSKDINHIQVQNAGGSMEAGSFMIKKTFTGLEPGKKYKVSVDITPNVANGTYSVLGSTEGVVALTTGTKTITTITTAYNSGNGVVQADFTIRLGAMGNNVVLDIKNPIVVEATSEDLTTPEATTPEPTTPDVTTETQEPTDKPTTNPTVKPTPNKKITVKKTKVKKAKKKKSSKKAKISLKKVKGVSGYQIKVYKSKKAKKALVKRTVTKAKFTLKSKKIKNRKKLYIKARAYKVVNGKKYYSKWSKKKKINITK